MNTIPKLHKAGLVLAAATLLFVAAARPLAAQATIPQGSTINSAVFSIYVINGPTYQTVAAHRITADWGETSVSWSSFANSFDPAIVGTFVTTGVGWQTIDVTALVQGWVSGAYPNFGLVLMQGKTPFNVYHSSEGLTGSLRPMLEIHYTTPGGVPSQVTIQRPAASQNDVADAYVWEMYPTYNGGTSDTLWTGNVEGYEKYSLIRFNFTVLPPAPGTGTPGYWKNHPDAWPDAGVTIGGVFYPKDDAIALMSLPVARDKTLTMFDALVAAKLNVLAGNDDSCIENFIDRADAWMTAYPPGSGVFAGGIRSPWRVGQPICNMLDAYNNGQLGCATHRD